jgi:hypothetical protein
LLLSLLPLLLALLLPLLLLLLLLLLQDAGPCAAAAPAGHAAWVKAGPDGSWAHTH